LFFNIQSAATSELLSKKLFSIEVGQLFSIMPHLPILTINDSVTKLKSTASVETTIQLLNLSTYYDEDETKQSVSKLLQITSEDLEERYKKQKEVVGWPTFTERLEELRLSLVDTKSWHRLVPNGKKNRNGDYVLKLKKFIVWGNEVADEETRSFLKNNKIPATGTSFDDSFPILTEPIVKRYLSYVVSHEGGKSTVGTSQIIVKMVRSLMKHQSTLCYHFVGNTMVTTFRMPSFKESVEMKTAVNNSKEKVSTLQGGVAVDGSNIVQSDIQRGQIFRPLTNDELEPLFHWFLRRKLARGVENRPKVIHIIFSMEFVIILCRRLCIKPYYEVTISDRNSSLGHILVS